MRITGISIYGECAFLCLLELMLLIHGMVDFSISG